MVTHLSDLTHIRPIIELFEKNNINHVLTLKNIFDDTSYKQNQNANYNC